MRIYRLARIALTCVAGHSALICHMHCAQPTRRVPFEAGLDMWLLFYLSVTCAQTENVKCLLCRSCRSLIHSGTKQRRRIWRCLRGPRQLVLRCGCWLSMLSGQGTAMVTACQPTTTHDVSYALLFSVPNNLGSIEVCNSAVLPATARSLRHIAQTSICS